MTGHIPAVLRRAGAALARFWRTVDELQERRLLLDRPWEERYLHWAQDGHQRVLHGELVPPRRGMSTTRGGWCGHAACPPDPARPRRP